MRSLIPALVAIFLVVLGVSYLVHARRWVRLVQELAERPERLFPMALVMLAAGVIIGYGYDSWHGTWPIFVTAFGWLLAVEGVVLLLVPGLVRRVITSVTDRFLLAYTRIGGVVVIVLGALLSRHYLF